MYGPTQNSLCSMQLQSGEFGNVDLGKVNRRDGGFGEGRPNRRVAQRGRGAGRTGGGEPGGVHRGRDRAKLMALGVPKEFVAIATEKVAAINGAYGEIAKERGI